jgi:hypothetical protein
MSLPYLPAPHIIPAFQMLIQGVDDPVLMKLVDIDQQHSVSDYFMVCDWSANTHQQWRWGWHRRVNKKAYDQTPPFYDLLALLHAEATLIPIQIKLVSEGKLYRHQRQQSRSNSASIMQPWNQYSNKEITITQLLKRCVRINGPVLDHWTSETFCIAYIDINM